MTGATLVGLVIGNRFRRASQARHGWPALRLSRSRFGIRVMVHDVVRPTSPAEDDIPATYGTTQLAQHHDTPMPLANGPAFNITPRLGVNQARYGMLRREVRQVLGQATSSIRRKSAGPADDVYGDHQVFIRYDASDRLEAVEFTDTADVSISHYRVGGLPFVLLQEQLLEWDPLASVLDGETRSTILGLQVVSGKHASGSWTMMVYPDRQP